MPASDEEATKLANAAGFLFQLRVEQEFSQRIILPGSMWKIAAREHRWTHTRASASGYIDLILDTGTIFLVVECKRASNGLWVFLSNKHAPPMQRAKLLWTYRKPGFDPVADWTDFAVTPPSAEAMFCIVRGHGEDGTPMLERVASNLILATEALAEEELALSNPSDLAKPRVFIPLLITNAELRVLRANPDAVDLATGRLDTTKSDAVALVRFRKSLASAIPSRQSTASITEAAQAGERTVLVMQSTALLETFKELDIPYKGWPWENL